ncbi:MAG: HAD family hydrolase [Boseongicola sp.]|nr:HAD family hydrolase [Boseongicola sp.]MDD9979407.1 HAD family hydrolase [Boseongicola sp.]
MRIAMWSGPRNLSTAMMYSFGARSDFAVWDEPFYGAYLAATGIDHPMRAETIANAETDPEKVAQRCLGPIPNSKSHFYMKHMPHHMVEGFPLDWADECINVHLIRHPARVVASYAAKRETVTLDDIGYRQQVDVYERVGGLVVDSFDIRQNPGKFLARLCAEIGLPFDDAMLRWSSGGHPQDGVWAAHWYGAVHRSTGFAGPEGEMPELDGDAAALAEEAVPYFNVLKSVAIS